MSWIFDIFSFLPILGVILGQKMRFFRFWAKIGPKLTPKRAKMKKYQKSNSQVLFVLLCPCLMQKIRKIEATGKELKFLEGHFLAIFFNMGNPIHFRRFAKIPQTPEAIKIEPLGVERWLTPHSLQKNQGYNIC